MISSSSKFSYSCYWGDSKQGTQPAGCIFDKIVKQFEEHLVEINEILTSKKGDTFSQISIKLKVSDEAITDTVWIRPYDNTIFIQEIYLNYLWIICYCSFSDFQEILENNYTLKGANEEQLKFNSIFSQYAASLFKRNTVWDLNKYPNPVCFMKKEGDLVNAATDLFIHALYFIIFHECSHAILDHGAVEQDKIDRDQLIADEYNADSFACQML